jgi:hypothetical protein
MKFYCAYLPQFHPTKRNSRFWGKNFTDWVTTREAKKLFKGHMQPKHPGNLGEYNLLDKKILKKHSILMKNSGIDAFAIYYYHFDKNLLALEKPLKIIIKNKDIKFKYFIFWTNTNWTKSWIGEDKVIIYKQNNSLEHAISVVENAIKFIKDGRYEKIDGRPVFAIYDCSKFNLKLFKSKVNKILQNNSIKNIFIIGNLSSVSKQDLKDCDAVINWPPDSLLLGKTKNFLRKYLPTYILRLEIVFKFCSTIDFSLYLNLFNLKILNLLKKHSNLIPTYVTSWDNTPRYGVRGILLKNVSADIFFDKVKSIVPHFKKRKVKAIFFKAWNEWAEGNVIEHSAEYKNSFIKNIKKLKKLFNIN